MRIRVLSPMALVCVFAAAAAAQHKGVLCPPGQRAASVTQGHCCWVGQIWTVAAGCIGQPTECPAGMEVHDERCIHSMPGQEKEAAKPKSRCLPGEVIGPDTAGHCCYPGQRWEVRQMTCSGVPTACPRGRVVEGEACVPAAAAKAATIPVAPVDEHKPPVAASEPALPTVDKLAGRDIFGPMFALAPQVAACYEKWKVPGVAMVSLVVAWTGKVESASVGGAFANTATGDCVAAVARTARFPAFRATRSQGISYPFRLP